MASFTVTWDSSYEADPADTDDANLLGDDARDIKRDVRERMVINHNWAGDAEDGTHKVAAFKAQGADPTLETGHAALYCKTVASKTELFWKDMDANVQQITSGGKFGFKSGAVGPAAVDGEYIGQRYFDTANVGWWTCTATGSPGTWAADISPKTIRFIYDTVVPAGWLTCDGTSSTPDFRGKTPVGYDSTDVDYDAIGEEAGSKTLTGSVTSDQCPNNTTHRHQADAQAGPPFNSAKDVHTHSIDISAVDSRPPLKTGQFIIKKPVV